MVPPQEQRLYDLIRKRTLASQMADAQLERTVVTLPVEGSEYAFTAQGEVITFRGFLDVYMESAAEDGTPETTKLLPPMKEGEGLTLKKLLAEERFTQRPHATPRPRLSGKMEELGIGRPSTYAPTIQTIQNRGYVERADREGTGAQLRRLSSDGGAIKRQVVRNSMAPIRASSSLRMWGSSSMTSSSPSSRASWTITSRRA